jgi:hypothetical protein
MKVLLATSPHVRHAAVLQSDFAPNNSVMYSFAPVGLLSLAAVLRKDRPQVTCEIYDLNRRILSGDLPLDATFYRSAAQDLCSKSPDVIGFMTECDSYHHVLRIAEAVKEITTDCAMVLGGPHASAVARQTMERSEAIDAIVIGEGEATLIDVLDALGSGTETPVPGAIVRDKAGRIVEGGARPLIGRLDDLPVPAYDLYRPDPGEEIFLEVGRGCPFQCEFCSTAPYWKRRHRVKSPQRILHEVRLLRDLFGTARVHFTHDLFTTNREWVRAVCDVLIEAGAPVRWTCSARTDTVDDDLLALMARAGCNAIYFGIESGSQRILREIRKDIPLSRSFEILQTCRRQGITPNAGFIAGFPSEDSESLQQTFAAYERALRLGCRPTHLFAYCPFADSTMYAGLRDLRCSGHFVDLPLGTETDVQNRQRIACDRDLYGSYFRPHLPDVVPGEVGAIAAIDEFSPLVEAALAPTLALAELTGGMHEVFRNWVRWIQRHNDERGAPAYRRGYGTAASFAKFVLDQLMASPEATASTLAVAQAVHTNLRVAESTSPEAATTMASHRSFVLPQLDELPELTLNTPLSRGAIVASLALEYDVTPALLGQSDGEFVMEPTYLVWQLMADRAVRLLRIDKAIFDALEVLRRRPSTVGDLMLESFGASDRRVPLAAEEPDPSTLLTSLASAAREGLVTIGPI